jgi:glycosyltransferase involved in cell wall biosynthesis
MNSHRPLSAIAWDGFQARTHALAALFGGTAWCIRPRRNQRALLPLRYIVDGVRTWRLLQAEQPEAVLVVSPPVFAPLTASIWAASHRRPLVVDCHTGAFHGFKWRWSRPLHRLLFRGAAAVLVHTEDDEKLVTSWRCRGFLLPDDVPDADLAAPRPLSDQPRVVIAGSFDANEPIALVLEAAGRLPEVEFRLTGDVRRLPAGLSALAPANVKFTGWLAYPDFLGELMAAHVVGVFSTDPHIMNRAAFEAVGLARPLVLSDLPGLRRRFGDAALMSANEPDAMAATLQTALHAREELAMRSARLRPRLREQHDQALSRLRNALGTQPA